MINGINLIRFLKLNYYENILKQFLTEKDLQAKTQMLILLLRKQIILNPLQIREKRFWMLDVTVILSLYRMLMFIIENTRNQMMIYLVQSSVRVPSISIRLFGWKFRLVLINLYHINLVNLSQNQEVQCIIHLQELVLLYYRNKQLTKVQLPWTVYHLIFIYQNVHNYRVMQHILGGIWKQQRIYYTHMKK